jgi:hypothetical protein
MKRTPFTQAELERRILYGLAAEWEIAANLQQIRHAGIQFRPPTFELAEIRFLGQWDAASQRIRMQRQFVLNHSWTDVVDVLLHEIAHQYVTQAYGDRDDAPHGRLFQEACRMFNASPAATERYSSFHEKPPMNDNDRLLQKVVKLFALAGSDNRHEAESAMMKAQTLIDRHNLDLVQGNRDRNFVSIRIGAARVRNPREVYALSALLSAFYHVEAIWLGTYVVESDKIGSVLEISGTPENVEIATYVHDFVARYIENHWVDFSRTCHGRRGQRERSAFALGIIQGFRKKLEENAQTARGPHGIVLANDPKRRQYFRERYPRIRHVSSSSARLDAASLNAGEQRGRDLVIARGIRDSGSSGTGKQLGS